MKISAKKIEILMARKNLAHKDLADRSGISRQNLTVIKQRGNCTPRLAMKIADGLDVDVTEIMEE